MVPMWIYPIAMACGQHVRVEAVLAHSGRDAAPGRTVEGGRAARRRLQRRLRRPRGRQRDPRAPRHRAIQFVGSTPVGRYVYETGTKNGKRVGAYTGAKNAMLVLPDADLDLAADSGGGGGLRLRRRALHGPDPGHRPSATSADRLLPMIESGSAALKVGPGVEPDSDMGPVYSAEHRASVIDWIDKGVAEGAELVVDGAGSTCMPSTRTATSWASPSSTTSPPSMEIYNEEIFGPSSASSA
jgi:malonate-semialdehyde dehydrogenase (acetylating)/methylmalonate-semialdehyde dehydrogenase